MRTVEVTELKLSYVCKCGTELSNLPTEGQIPSDLKCPFCRANLEELKSALQTFRRLLEEAKTNPQLKLQIPRSRNKSEQKG
jgi:hypothetical protein